MPLRPKGCCEGMTIACGRVLEPFVAGEEGAGGGEGKLWWSMPCPWCPVCWTVKLSRRLLDDLVVRVGPAPELLPAPVALTDEPRARERERDPERRWLVLDLAVVDAVPAAPGGEGVSRAGPPLLAGEYTWLLYADDGCANP